MASNPSKRRPAGDPLVAAYPHIARWVREQGWIEIGEDQSPTGSFARVLDEVGLIWEGGTPDWTLSMPFQAMEQAIAEWWDG